MTDRVRFWTSIVLWVAASLVATLAVPWLLRYAFFDRVPTALLAADFGVTEKAIRTAASLFQMLLAWCMMGAFLALQALVNSVSTYGRTSTHIVSLYQHLDRISASVGQLADIARVHAQLLAAGSSNTAEVAALLRSFEERLEAHRRELNNDISQRIGATEERLRGEWRFVAGLLPAVIFGAIGLGLTLLFGMIMMFKR